MLVLSRRIGERVLIGEDIWVTVLDVRDGRCRLGIEAPNNVAIHREEVRGKRETKLKSSKTEQERKEADLRAIRRHPQAYLTVGDIDKPFHRPECGCEHCESWRRSEGRPTHKEIRKQLEGDHNDKEGL